MSDTQSQLDLTFVREAIAPPQTPPVAARSPGAWLGRNLFSTPGNTFLTLVGAIVLVLAIPPLARWAVFDAVWQGADRTACMRQGSGACWTFVGHNLGLFVYGHYPPASRWRVDVTFLLFVAGLLPLLVPAAPFKRVNALYLFVLFPVAAFVLLSGGVFGLTKIDTQAWGGLMLTFVVSFVGMECSFPLGVLLALGRRSRMRGVRTMAIAFIEFWRGVPLITIIFMAGVMLPFFLPAGVNFDKLMRALIGIALFASAYMAEVIRGGLQAVPRGQYEGARALGLGPAQTMRLVILPQALKLVIPGIVNIFIGLFKDTSLVYIIGLFDFLNIVRAAFTVPEWLTAGTATTGLVFAALVYCVFCFAMSRYSQAIERRVNRDLRS